MTTPPADSDSANTSLRSPTVQAAQCEAGLRRVLAYICARRHRRLIAGIVVFLMLNMAIGLVTSIPFTLLTPFLPLIGGGSLFETIYEKPLILALWVFVTDLLLPLAITLMMFARIRRIYRGY